VADFELAIDFDRHFRGIHGLSFTSAGANAGPHHSTALPPPLRGHST
jgi:hypothetical protein